MFERVLQYLPRTINARLNGFRGAASGLGDLRVAHVLMSEEQDCLAQIRRQRGDGGLDDLQPLAVIQLLIRGRGRSGGFLMRCFRVIH